MNILFITLSRFKSLEEKNISTGWLRQFVNCGHHVDVISPIEKKYGEKTSISVDGKGNRILNLKVGNMQKCNIIEKGISTLTIENKLIKGVKKYFSDVKYDYVLFSTPPITFEKVVRYVKKRDKAVAYLMLKDIFPQNAVDIGVMSKKSIIYKFFRKKESKLYQCADYIGCMSPANVNYIIKHNPEIDASVVEVCPNAIEPKVYIPYDKNELKNKFGLPIDKKIFIYGGNLGKPQNVDFIIKVLQKNNGMKDRLFVICGTGTDDWKIKKYIEEEQPEHVKYMSWLPKEEYDEFLKACDIGMIFLDFRFTIPNFPSRILSYMENKMPVVAFTDVNTDIGEVITENGFGWWEKSLHAETCLNILNNICMCTDDELGHMGNKAYDYLLVNYNVCKLDILKKEKYK